MTGFVAEDFIQSRIHGLENIDALVAEWSRRLPIPEETIRAYLTTNIHYILDEECMEGMRGFFRMAAEARRPAANTAFSESHRDWCDQNESAVSKATPAC